MKQKLLNRLFLLTLLAWGGVILNPAWGETYTELFKIGSGQVVNGTSYKAHEGTVDDRGYIITFGGNNKSVGTNSSNRSSCNLTSYSKYAVSPVTTSSTASVFACTTEISDVAKISYTFLGGSNQTSTNVYLLYSDDNETFSQVSLVSGTQGAAILNNTAYTFDKKTGYFALLFVATNTSGNWRIDDVYIHFYKEDTPAYTITAKSNDDSYGTVSLSGSVITATPAAGYTYADPAYTVSPDNSATVAKNGDEFTVTPSDNTTVTINFEAIPTYTVTLGDDNTTLTEATGNSGVTLPTRSTLNGYAFAGWSETNVSSETTTAPTIIPTNQTYYPTADITLYPVYTKTETSSAAQDVTKSVSISDYATDHSWSNGTQYTSVSLDENVTATASNSSGSNTGKYYTNGNDWRFYQNETAKLTITTTNGTLKSATLTFSVGNTGQLTYNSSAVTSGTAVSLSGTSAEFIVGNSGSESNGQVKFTEISVTYTSASTSTTYYWSSPVAAAVERPVISVASTFLFSTTATITCATEGATIKYSYDGETWSDYSSALTITETKTIYAKAIKGEDESSVAQVTATKNLAEPTVTVSGDLTLDLDGETNVSAGTLTAAVTYEGEDVAGATVTWSSSDTDIATINASTGAVTIIATGEVTFTATYAGNSDYAEATGTKTVTVVDSNVPGTTAENPYTVAEAINAYTAAGEDLSNIYVTGIVSEIVTAYSSQYGNISYNISVDGETTSTQLQAFRGKSYNGNNFTSADDIQVGDVVVLYGTLTYFNNTTYELTANNQLISLSRKEAAIITVTGGTEFTIDRTKDEEELTLTAIANSGATVVFTVDTENTTIDASNYEFEDDYLLVSGTKGGVIIIKANAPAAGNYKAATEVTITVTVIGEKEDVVFDVEDTNLAYGSTLTLVEDNHFLTDGDVTLTSSNTAVATVSGLTITPVAVGTTTITITAAESTTYKAGSETFTLTVTAPEGTSTAYVAAATTETLDFTNNDWGLPTDYDNTETERTYTNDDYTIKLYGPTTNGFKFGGSYLIMGKSGAYLTLPAFDKAVTQIDVVGKSGASTFVKQNIYVGEAAVSTATTGATGTNTYAIASDYQAAGNIYTLKVTSAHNTQITSIVVHFAAEPLTATLNAYGYATFCSEYPFDFSEATGYSAWQITGISSENVITFSQITGSVKGGQGILLKGEPGATVTLTSANSDNTLGGNLLEGTLAPKYVAAGEYYGLSGNTFVKVNAGTVPAGKALLDADWIEESAGAKAFTFVFEDEADGLKDLKDLKDLRDSNDPIYNLAGQRLSRMQKGINIVNGKKIMK